MRIKKRQKERRNYIEAKIQYIDRQAWKMKQSVIGSGER
jgi:hypothetical protein